MNSTTLFLLAGLALLIGLFFAFKPQTEQSTQTNQTATQSGQTEIPQVSNEDRFTVAITDGKNVAGTQTYKSIQDKTVVFVISSNVAGDFHVHAPYDLDVDLKPNGTVELNFKADKTGRFELEYHPQQGEHVSLGALEVSPK